MAPRRRGYPRLVHGDDPQAIKSRWAKVGNPPDDLGRWPLPAFTTPPARSRARFTGASRPMHGLHIRPSMTPPSRRTVPGRSPLRRFPCDLPPTRHFAEQRPQPPERMRRVLDHAFLRGRRRPAGSLGLRRVHGFRRTTAQLVCSQSASHSPPAGHPPTGPAANRCREPRIGNTGTPRSSRSQGETR